MGNQADRRRRAIGVICLGTAVLMLIAGETVLRGSFGKSGFLIYWLVCFGFTFLAILVAFWDLTAVSRRTRKEQRLLLEQTLKEIAKEKEAKERERLKTGDSK